MAISRSGTSRPLSASGEPTEVHLQGLNALITAQTLQGPVKATGEAVYRAVPFSFSLDAGTYVAGRPTALSVSLKAKNEPVQGAFDGALTDAVPHASVNGKLTLSGDDLAGVIRMANAEVKPARKVAPDFTSHKPFSFETKLSGSIEQAKLDEIALAVGDAHGSGAATLSLINGGAFDVALQVNSLDLDAFLKPGAAPERNSGGATVVDIGQGGATPFELPTKLNGSFDLGIAALGYHGGTVRQVRFTADLKDGKASITRASALLPGGSDVSGTGALVAEDGKPSFTGTVKGTSSNLRAILDWFNAESGRYPGGPSDQAGVEQRRSGQGRYGDLQQSRRHARHVPYRRKRQPDLRCASQHRARCGCGPPQSRRLSRARGNTAGEWRAPAAGPASWPAGPKDAAARRRSEPAPARGACGFRRCAQGEDRPCDHDGRVGG